MCRTWTMRRCAVHDDTLLEVLRRAGSRRIESYRFAEIPYSHHKLADGCVRERNDTLGEAVRGYLDASALGVMVPCLPVIESAGNLNTVSIWSLNHSVRR